MGHPTQITTTHAPRDVTAGGGELTSRAAPGAWTSGEIRSVFLVADQLVPRRRARARAGSAEVRELQVLDELAASSRAAGTRTSYGRHVRAWLSWADERGVCPLPAAAEDVVQYLVEYALARDERGDPVRDGEGALMGRVTAGTVAQFMAALNRLHELAGFPKPGSDPTVSEVVHGIRRTFGTRATRAKAALTWNLLERTLAGGGPIATADLRRSLVRALHESTAATPGQLARLDWGDLTWTSNDEVEVRLPVTHVGTPRRSVTLRREPGNPECVVNLLTTWHERVADSGGAALLAAANGTRPSRQGIDKMLKSTPPQGGDEADVPGAVRDRAVLLVGWTTALRRSNLAHLNWDDVTPLRNGWSVQVARSKTDQQGRGATKYVPPAPAGSGLADAAQALAAWYRVVTAALGFDPRSVRGIPVFCRVSRHGRLVRDGQSLARLSGEAINMIVRRRADQSGVSQGTHLSARGFPVPSGVAPFGAHSLRAGFVTESLQRDQPLSGIQAVTGHRSVNSVSVYHRPATRPDVTAALDIMAALAKPPVLAAPAPPARRRVRAAEAVWAGDLRPGRGTADAPVMDGNG